MKEVLFRVSVKDECKEEPADLLGHNTVVSTTQPATTALTARYLVHALTVQNFIFLVPL